MPLGRLSVWQLHSDSYDLILESGSCNPHRIGVRCRLYTRRRKSAVKKIILMTREIVRVACFHSLTLLSFIESPKAPTIVLATVYKLICMSGTFHVHDNMSTAIRIWRVTSFVTQLASPRVRTGYNDATNVCDRRVVQRSRWSCIILWHWTKK